MAHWSSCAVHNAPALPVGGCDCGNDAPEGFNEAEGYAASLRQQASLIDGFGIDGLDSDELRAAADFIDRQQREIEALKHDIERHLKIISAELSPVIL